VVKANAYGHGLAEVVSVLEPLVDALQVDDLDELRALRQMSQKRALVFGYVPEDGLAEALALGCELTVYEVEQIEALGHIAASLNTKAKIHLKIDALLGRLGVLPEQIEGVVRALQEQPRLELVSAYGHYANIEDTNDPSHSLLQEAVFDSGYQILSRAFPGVGRHLSATSGLMAREEVCPKDLVRLGIGVYGLYPSDALALSHADLSLMPVLRWVSRLAQVKTLPVDHPVSYGLTYVTSRPTLVGVVPQGYSDGFDRGLSNCGVVLVGGRRCPVIGRVAMNMFMVDLSAVPEARMGDEVVLVGSQDGDSVSAEEMAGLIGTINYEVVARVSALLPRRLVE
jgi:alanine racemase